MQYLDPLAIPLRGRRLIEASAGTGKTYCIVLFYLRLLLEEQLTTDRILVVTFTTAATEELRHRVRGRIREALDILEGRGSGDPVLEDLLNQSAPDRDLARQLLSDALTCMDEAAIHTIHGFCQRMLQDHAFESGVPFAIEFLESEAPLRQRIMEDFWRARFYPAPEAEARWAEKTWTDPAGLLRALAGPLGNRLAEPALRVDEETLAGLRREVNRLHEAVRQRWPADRQAVQQILAHDPCLSRAGTSYRHDRVADLLAGMDRFAEQRPPAWELPPGLELLASSVMAKKLKRNCTPQGHPFFDLFDRFRSVLERFLAESRTQVLLAARDHLFAELDRRKEEQDLMHFDDLLLRLHAALAGPDGGRLLAARIRERYPVALVDEFQDTDPLQYRIFEAIYPADAGTLLMIGDPKQAIYSFRGADIFTYIRARRDTPREQRYTMATNHRSAPAMVEAVNRLFAVPAAFIFAGDIPFTPVTAAEQAPPLLLLDGSEPLPLQCLRLAPELAKRPGQPMARETATTASARISAARIAALLALAAEGRALLGTEPLRAADIAVLVRTHREAGIMRQALAAHGISSVYSSRESIFTSPEALEMQRLLAVMAAPADESLVRGLLAGDLVGLDGHDLERLQEDEPGRETLLATLRDAGKILQQEGFLPMFQALVGEHRLAPRLSAQPGGERKLTNYLHLAELLQEAWDAGAGVDALLRWLNQQISSPDQDADSQQLRLESDEELVQIVTIHKAKGLEYPLVFLPFLWSGRSPKAEQPFSYHRRDDLRLMVDPGTGDPERLALATEEQLAEELRLFYVAVTRARNCCFFCWGRVRGMELSAPAWLLHRDGDRARLPDEQQLQAELLALNTAGPILQLHDESAEAPAATGPPASAAGPPQPRRFSGRIDTGWRISSYTQLAAEHKPGPAAAGEQPALPQPSPFTFPRGAAAGTCLHAILEELDFTGRKGDPDEVVARHLTRAGIDQAWQPVVCAWMDSVLDTVLDHDTMRLRLLADGDRLVELGFHFPLAGLDLRCLNDLLADAGIRPLARESGTLRGLMKGFIDLVFRFDGRYFLADYKSNHLGDSPAEYAPGRLTQVMAEHHYDLQCLIYTLALHRFLASRISDYDYDHHFGGGLYLFLRGMHPDHEPGTGIHLLRPPRQLVEELDHLCQGVTP